MRSWFSHLWSSSARRAGSRQRRIVLSIEHLEDRLVPAPMVFTVTDTSDASANSLRAAITASNANNPGAGMSNTIDFAITGAGVQNISLLSALPTISQAVVIDGYSENNSSTQATANTLANADNAVILIQLDGTGAGAAVNGLTLGAGSGGSTIRGLAVNNFTGNGIVLQSNGNTIAGNFVGVNAAGTTRMPNGTFPNSGDGILVENGSNNVIGGTTPADRNIASGNAIDGIHIVGDVAAPATGNIVQGNFVGVAADGKSSVGNRTEPAPATGAAEGNNVFGIQVSGGNLNLIGGTVAGARNVVGLNGLGIEIDNGGQSNVIQGNFSGVGADGVTPAGNLLHGIVLRSSNGFSAPLGPPQANEPGVSFNLIGGTTAGAGNLVEFNGTGGVAVFGNPVSASGQPNIGNAIEGNSIFQNGRSNPSFLLGIDLTNAFLFFKDDGLTPNDSKGHGAPNDPNNFQNFPVLTSAASSGGNTTITGVLHSAAGSTYRIEFFANDADPMGASPEGQQFLGSTSVTTDATDNANFNVSLAVPVANGRIVTATATDAIGNTSEFSAGLTVPTALPTVQFAATTQSVNENGGTFTVTVNLPAMSSVDATIPFTLSGTAVSGTDYSGVTTSPLVIKAGQTFGTITGTLLDDGKYGAPNKTLTLTLGTPTNATVGTNGSDTLTIQESDPKPTVQFAAATQSVNENGGMFTVTVNLSAPSSVDATIPFTLSGTAAPGVDYSGVTMSPLVIPAGQISATITGTLLPDPGSNRTITFTLGAPTNATLGATTSDTLTIVEPALPPPPPPPQQLQPPSVSVGFGPFGEVIELVNSVGALTQFDASGAHQLNTNGVRSASVAFGAAGEVLLVTYANGALYQFDAAGAHVLGGSGVLSASMAIGPFGEVVEMVNTAGFLTQFDATGAHVLGGGVQSASVAFGSAGEVLEIVNAAGGLTQFDAAGAHPLSASGVQSASPAYVNNSLVLDIIFSDGSLDQFDVFGRHLLGVVS